MSRYNHFSKAKYESISFGELEVGARFRMDLFKNGRRRSDIIMVKLSPFSYKEIKSGKETTVHHSAFDVSCYDKLSIPNQPK